MTTMARPTWQALVIARQASLPLNAETLIRNLTRWHDQVKATSIGGSEAMNIMVSAVRACNQCHQSIRGWLGRKPGRVKELRRIRAHYDVPSCNKVLRDLIKVAVSAVSACVCTRSFFPGPAAVKFRPRVISPAAIAKREATKARLKGEAEAAFQARLFA